MWSVAVKFLPVVPQLQPFLFSPSLSERLSNFLVIAFVSHSLKEVVTSQDHHSQVE